MRFNFSATEGNVPEPTKKSATIELIFESGEKKLTGNIIGKNSDYIFLQTMDKSIKAIPIQTDVQEIIISKPK